MEKALESAAREWQVTFESINDAVALMDIDGTIRRCNGAMGRLAGRSLPEILERNAGRRCMERRSLYRIARLLKMKKSKKREELVLKAGDKWLHVIVDPVFDSEGEMVAAVHTVADITKERAIQEALKESEQRMKIAQSLGKIGHWEFDLATSHITWSDEVFSIYERNIALGLRHRKRRPDIIPPRLPN